MYFALKCGVSGVLIGIISTVAQRSPGLGALIASLPLISILGMIWLWVERPDVENIAVHAEATFWYVLPSLPMFLLLPRLLRASIPFGFALTICCVLTAALYGAMITVGGRFGLKL